jgi:hypothetical protein
MESLHRQLGDPALGGGEDDVVPFLCDCGNGYQPGLAGEFHRLHATAVSLLRGKALNRCAFAIAFLSEDDDIGSIPGDAHAHHGIIVPELDCQDARC